jgi:isopentenyl-diphosphate delta-isomerase
MAEDLVVLVDPRDNDLGTAPKLAAHLDGRLHRAVSVFVYDRSGRMLLQRRAAEKYHSSGLWSNACCTHPRPNENPHRAATRRLKEEMGLLTRLEHAFAFIYRAELDNALIEHELDHVFVGIGDDDPLPDPDEVMDWRWVAPADLERELEEDPDRFTSWFRMVVPRLAERRSFSPSAAP